MTPRASEVYSSSLGTARVLAALADWRWWTISELSDETGLVAEAVRLIVRELIRRGWVNRAIAGWWAGRVQLTEEGLAEAEFRRQLGER